VLLDATFYRNGEIPRDMAEVPHPFVEETIKLLQTLPAAERAKVYFIHLNHTNPLLNPDSPERREVQRLGFKVATEGLELPL
jgi:pyrroloquinoline quinone biosynthesis protein B